jgi:hypothetical protein
VGRRKSELKGEPIPATSRPGAISPDGHLMAYLVGNRVELIPLQPDAVELAYRRDLMRPNFRLYREAYDAAVKANKAGEALARLRQVMVGRRQAEDQESLGFLREAETIELDRVFPADPFAR